MPRIVRVAVPVPLPRLFDYLVPDADFPAIGCRVAVPFARRDVVGVVLEHPAQSDIELSQLKPVTAVLDTQPLLSAELIATLNWAARYYQHPIGEVFDAALPVRLRSARDLPISGEPAVQLTEAGRAAVIDPQRRRGTRVDALLEILSEGVHALNLLDERLPEWRNAARSLRTRGWAEMQVLPRSQIRRTPIPAPPLNSEQATAVAEISRALGRFQPFLLDGVTGSGKTEVYLAAISEVVARGQQALVLVPEIALTPQTTRRFRERLGLDIAILHSGLSEGERARAWLAAARGEAQVILGTRSAAFVPMTAPGLIVVDEEHDASYKQHEGFRYHARDLVVMRARSLGVPIVLGSATPSIESLVNVAAKRYRGLALVHRAGVAKPPSLQVMDLRRKRLDNGLAISTLTAIGEHLARDEQVLVFRNRRGYAPVLFCQSCGWSAQCVRCDRPLTVHRGEKRLRCHHCAAEAPVPKTCPECSGIALAPQGQGTERLEETLSARFPNVPVIRVDRDTTRNRAGRDALFEDFNAPGARILVGTQMLAKGHDLPNLTLVVVAGVDEGLYSVDFRAAERLGQLIVQVAGRAGRAERAGAVILQTYHPDHPLLGALLSGGYPALVRGLIAERRAASLPPFSQFALLRAEAQTHAEVSAFLESAAELSRSMKTAASVHGPMPAPMPRRAGYQRSQLLIETNERTTMQSFLADWIAQLRVLPQARKVRWSIDVDPVEMG